MTLNSVKTECQCKPGFFPNIIKGLLDIQKPCLLCPEGCMYCLNATTCLACDLTTYLVNGTCNS